jgi:hypothetical protein
VARADMKKLEKDMDEFMNNEEGKTDDFKVQPFPFFIPKFVVLNGFPIAGQHTETKGGIAEAGRGREDATERNPGGNAGARFVYV